VPEQKKVFDRLQTTKSRRDEKSDGECARNAGLRWDRKVLVRFLA